MTLASEATLACELGMEFAALCTVDNYANGLGSEVVSYEQILSKSREHSARTEEIVTKIIRKMR
jgi:5'-methylthioadenosine phosphorylase